MSQDKSLPSEPRRTPDEIVNDMMLGMGAVAADPEMPRHRKQVCAMMEHLTRRAHAAGTFKTWGTPEEIAANIGKAKLPEPQSPAILSRLFPFAPTAQSQSFSDVLE